MRIKALKTIIALAEHNCDFEIHKIFGILRSTIWTHINEVEKETGLTIIKRQKQNTALTEEGIAFIPYAKKMYAIFENAVHTIKTPEQSRGIGEISVITTEEICINWLMPSIKRLHTQYPKLKIHVLSENKISKKQERMADILLQPSSNLDEFDKEWLIFLHHGLFASRSYLKRAGTPEDPKDLINHCILSYGEDEFTYFDQINWHLKGSKYGLPKLRPTLTVSSNHSLSLAAKIGIGICSAPIEYKSDLQHILPKVQGPKLEISFCRKKNISVNKLKNIEIVSSALRDYLSAKKFDVHINQVDKIMM